MTLAVIMQMRKRVGLLIGIIGVAIVAFLMMDAINSSSSIFNGNSQNVIGEINGEEVIYEAFNAKDKQVEKQFLYFQGNWQDPNFTGFTEEERLQIRNFAWNEFVLNSFLDDQYVSLGLTVTEQEINNQFASNNPRGEVRNFYQQVVDNSGAYNPQQMTSVIQQIEALSPQDQNYVIKDFFLQLKELLKQEMLRNKYQQLFAKSSYVPQWKAQQDYMMANTTADLKIVGLQYATLQEENIEPTEAELETYLKEHKAEFESPSTRDIEYVIFNILPSKEDSMEALNFVNEKWAQIAKNGRDSIFINQYSETRFSGAYFTQDEILTQVADSLFQVEPGTVIGPYLENGKYRIAKLYDRESLSDSVRIRHVFADYRQLSQDDARNLIDSVQLMYNQGMSFDSLVIKFTTDQASIQTGGDLGYLSPSGNINRPIFNAIFRDNNEIGTPFVVESPAGVHFMEITERGAEKEMVKYNILDRSIRPGTKTRDSIYTLASRFFTKYGTVDSFDAGIAQYNLVKRFGDNLTGNEVSLGGMSVPAREIMRWAFEEETVTGNVQLFKNYESTDNKYVIAKLTNATIANEPTVAGVREELRAKVILEKKAGQLRNQLATAAAGATSLEQIAQKLGVEVQTSNGVSFKTQFIDGVGSEPIIAAVGAGLAVNAISSPVKGQYGVYLVQKTAENPATAPQDLSVTQNQLRAALSSRFGQNLLDQLRTATDVTDMRYKFY